MMTNRRIGWIRIQRSVRKYGCAQIDSNIYQFPYYDESLEACRKNKFYFSVSGVWVCMAASREVQTFPGNEVLLLKDLLKDRGLLEEYMRSRYPACHDCFTAGMFFNKNKSCTQEGSSYAVFIMAVCCKRRSCIIIYSQA